VARFDGQGQGSAHGAPLEAIVQDLCDTRRDLKRTAEAVDKMRDVGLATKSVMEAMLLAMNEMRDIMRELREASREGVAEAKAWHAHMDEMKGKLDASRAALEENTRVARKP